MTTPIAAARSNDTSIRPSPGATFCPCSANWRASSSSEGTASADRSPMIVTNTPGSSARTSITCAGLVRPPLAVYVVLLNPANCASVATRHPAGTSSVQG
ncbi:MAG: hypothetical protein ACK5Z4_15105 [Planctomyces sp.]